MSFSIKSIDKSLVIKWLAVLLATAVLFFMPVNEVFTLTIKNFFIITVFGILCFALDLLPMMVIAIWFPIMFWLCKVVPIEQAFSSWTNDSVWFMFFSLVMGISLDQTGVLRRFIYWALEKLGGSINVFVFGYTAIAAVGHYIGLGSLSTLALFIFYAFAKGLNVKPGSNMGAYLFWALILIYTCQATMLTYDVFFNICTSVGAAACAAAGLTVDPSVFSVTFYTYAFHNIIFFPEVFVLLFAFYKLNPPEKEYKMSKDMFKAEREALGPIQRKEKLAILPILVMLSLYITQKWTGLTVTQCMAIGTFFCFIPVIGIGTSQVFKELNFQILFLIAGCLSIGVVANATGAGAMISNFVMPILGETPISMTATSFIMAYLVNFLLTPMAASTVLGAPLSVIAVSHGLNPIPVFYTFIQGLNNLLMPYEGAGYMMIFSFGYMTMKQFMKNAVVKTIIMLLWLLIFAVPYWHLLGIWYL